MRKKNGFSLLELALAIFFIGVIFVIAANMLKISLKTKDIGGKTFRLQSDVRAAAQNAMNHIRYAKSAIYTIPKDCFGKDKYKDPGWSYFGIEDAISPGGMPANQIVQYQWNGSDWNPPTILVKPNDNVTYSLVFSKNPDAAESDDMLNFTIEGYYDGNTSKPYVTIEGGSMGMNAVRALDQWWEDDYPEYAGSPAVAIAYRTDEAPGSGMSVGHVVVAIDVSHTMTYYMTEHKKALEAGEMRIDYVKPIVEDMIKKFALYNYFNVSFISFSNWAKPYPFVNASAGSAELMNYLDDIVQTIYNSTPSTCTNTGDAIRRAYWQLKRQNDDAVGKGLSPENYFILLTDGLSNMCSIRELSKSAVEATVETMGSIPLTEDDYILDESSFESDYAVILEDPKYLPDGDRKSWDILPLETGSNDTFHLAVQFWDYYLNPYVTDYVSACGDMLTNHSMKAAPLVKPPITYIAVIGPDDDPQVPYAEFASRLVSALRVDIGHDSWSITDSLELNNSIDKAYTEISTYLAQINAPKLKGE